ncbi:MAG: hypothetical protein K1X88_31260 [Nannocystaceae bacterium]|nr:hypothetical protein [Nannocystaceae bacterium]
MHSADAGPGRAVLGVANDTAEAVGQPCSLSRGRACIPGAYCSREGVCKEVIEPGGACDSPRSCKDDPDGAESYCSGISPTSSTLGACVPVVAPDETCDPAEYESCGYARGCSSEGRCLDDWPHVCEALALAPGEYDPIDWIPQ